MMASMILTHRDWQAKIPSSAPIAASITTSPAARVQAARFVLEAAGHGIENRRLLARSGDDDEKPLHQLSLQTLEALAHAAEIQVREARGTIIEVEEFCTLGTPPNALSGAVLRLSYKVA